MSETPWYQEGLQFECTGCGDCCTGSPGYVWVNREEIMALAAQIGVEVDYFEKHYVRRVGIRLTLVDFPNGDCVFFDNQTRRCNVYENRPRQCRTWPFWNSNVRTAEAWKAAKEVCPGCGQGQLFTAEQITERVQVIRV